MDGHNKIVIIGGGACGPKTAARARRLDAYASITMIQDGSVVSYAACGLPYLISGVVSSKNNLIARTPEAFKKDGIDVLTDTIVEKINRTAHKVEVLNRKNNERSTIDYDKLVIATGAKPLIPPLEGIDLKGIFTLKRISDAEYIIQLIDIAKSKSALIIGAGLIGMEMAESLSTRGFKVTIVEALETIMPALLDAEISDSLTKHLKEKGVILKTGQKVQRFEGENGKVARAFTDKETFEAELVLISIGIRPESKLASEAGLEIGKFGDISVNEFLQTSDPDIYAGGDCIANTSLITGQKVYVPLGSTANKHGHVIAVNVTGGNAQFSGVVSSACAKIFDMNVGRVGLGEKQAIEAGYSVVCSLLSGSDKPGYYPDSRGITIKLVVDQKTHRILGGQGIGSGDIIKRIDVLATAITTGMTVDMLTQLDLAYAPPFNSAMDVLHHSASLAVNKAANS